MKTTLQNRIATMVHAFGDEGRKRAVRLLAADAAEAELQLSALRDTIRQLREAGSDMHSELINARYRLHTLGSATSDLPGTAAIKRWCVLTK